MTLDAGCPFVFTYETDPDLNAFTHTRFFILLQQCCSRRECRLQKKKGVIRGVSQDGAIS